MDTIKLTINGRQVEAKKGVTVLEAALAADVYIPTLCYDPDLKPMGVVASAWLRLKGCGAWLAHALPQQPRVW